VGGGRFAFYAFNNTPAGGNDDALGGSLNALRSLFKGYADERTSDRRGSRAAENLPR
jgi:hypothetical protein